MKLKNIFIALSIAAVALSAQSCFKQDQPNYIYANATVTVKPFNDKTFLMQLDDSTTLKAKNITTSPFADKKVRAIAAIDPEDLKMIQNDVRTSEPKQYDVTVHYIDSIRTKLMAPDFGDKNIEKYGNDPVELVGSFETSCEDNYLTLRIRTYWGMNMHEFNVVATDKEDPYKLTLYQNSFKDFNDRVADALIAFDLSSLPDTQGKFVTLSLNYQSFTGPKTVKFKYMTRK